MSDRSAIEWTDASWNPIRARRRLKDGTVLTGWHCTHKSEGCRGCYAEGFNLRLGTKLPYKPGHERDIEIFLDEKILLQPLRWQRPRTIFVGSMTDIFADFVSDDMLERMFAVMAAAHMHRFQVLTKRPDRMRAFFAETWQPAPARDVEILGEVHHVPAESRRSTRMDRINNTIDWIDFPVHRFNRFWTPEGALIGRPEPHKPLPNVWLGTSVEDQAAANERIPHLLATPSAVRFLSCEPLLGRVDVCEPLGIWWNCTTKAWVREHDPLIDWIICGGESGPKARPMHPDWARSLRDQCAAAGVPFFFKQWGEWAPLDALRLDGARAATDGPVSDSRGHVRDWMNRYVTFENDAGAQRLRGHSFTGHATDLAYRVGKKAAGRLLDGVQHDGMPA